MNTTEKGPLLKYIKEVTEKRRNKINSGEQNAIRMRKDILDIFLQSDNVSSKIINVKSAYS
jgi:hypothetical protein